MRRRQHLAADEVLVRVIGYAFLTLFGLVCVLPFYMIVISSFASEESIIRHGFRLIPESFSLEAYRIIFQNPQRIVQAYGNTIFVTITGTLLSLLMSTLTGYVLSRKDFDLRNGFSFYFFFTTLFSGGLTPWYILCTRYLHVKNSYWGLIVPMMFSVWNMMIAKNYMKGIPYEMTESAKLDGASELTIYLRLYLPVSLPLLATLGLFSALGYWNDWYYSMLFNIDPRYQSLQYFLHETLNSAQALKQLVSTGNSSLAANIVLPSNSMKMAMTCIVTGPIILLYPLLQRYFVKGMTVGAVKG